MTIITYQSFNANSSLDHGLASMSDQHFTRQANAHVTGQGDRALVWPKGGGGLVNGVYEGPPHLRPVGPMVPQTRQAVGQHLHLIWQNFQRRFGDTPDILVCGEIDLFHGDFAGLVQDGSLTVRAHKAQKACQCFSAISQTRQSSQVAFLAEGVGFVAYSVAGINVAFVHVPNAIARSGPEAKNFYRTVSQSILGLNRSIDLVIGDTNQTSLGFTAGALSDAFNGVAYRNAAAGDKVERIDGYEVAPRGTNSTGTMMYDVAVYRADTVELEAYAYLSQSPSGETMTDHCGLGVKVRRR